MAVELDGHVCRVKDFPIGIDYESYRTMGQAEGIRKKGHPAGRRETGIQNHTSGSIG